MDSSVLGMPSVEDWPVNCSVGHEFFRSSPRDNLSYLDRFCKYVGMRGVDLMKVSRFSSLCPSSLAPCERLMMRRVVCFRPYFSYRVDCQFATFTLRKSGCCALQKS